MFSHLLSHLESGYPLCYHPPTPPLLRLLLLVCGSHQGLSPRVLCKLLLRCIINRALTLKTSESVLDVLPEISLQAEMLVTTPTLNQIHCAYNTRYGLFICKLCKVGVPAGLLGDHARAVSHSVKKVEDSKVGYRSIPHGFPVMGRSITDTIKGEVRGILHDSDVKFRDYITDGNDSGKWAELPIPLPGQQCGVMGLEVHLGFACGSCDDYFSLSKGTIDTHRRI